MIDKGSDAAEGIMTGYVYIRNRGLFIMPTRAVEAGNTNMSNQEAPMLLTRSDVSSTSRTMISIPADL